MANPNFVPSFSTNEVFRDLDQSRCLTDDLDTIETGLAGKASLDHTHTGYAADTHTHNEYAVSNHEHTGYATSNHAHDGYAASTHTHTPSEIGAATADHAHSGYASSSHNHDGDYLPATGDVNIDGVLRVGSQQAFHYASATASQTIGTNNATGGTTIGCGASANTTINGANVKTKNAIPQASNSYNLGSTTYRWKGIYSNTEVNVASDERLKRDITHLDTKALVDFIEKLSVVSYNYKSDSTDKNARIGLIAQDVQRADGEIAKYFVSEDENGMLGLTPADLVFPLIAAVQYLTCRVEELESNR